MALPNAAAIRQMYVDAALTSEGKSRVDTSKVVAAVQAAIKKEGLDLRAFSSGSVGAQVRVKVEVQNDEGETLVLAGQVLLTIPETVDKSKK